MATEITTVWNGELVEASSLSITAGQEVDMLVSGDTVLDNQAGTIYNSCRVKTKYEDLLPAGVLLSASIGCVLEFKNQSGIWELTPCYQFSPIRKSDQALERILVLQPNVDTFSLGVEDVMFPLNKEVCRVSRSQGTLPEAYVRLRFFLVDSDPNGSSAFESVKISVEVEKYNV